MKDRSGSNQRPSPEALLDAAGREHRGKLKLFLGAAPGVGKTYEMLTSAHDLRRQGIDIVLGLIETHGRAETEALVQDLEMMPRLEIVYRGHTLAEMNVPAILARRPRVALVDELAHTNAPGSPHPKRYQDVEDLLNAGIDVYTTLNVQHVESLNDIVAQITRIHVRETVPDRLIELADEIKLVDLSPEALIQRLHEGKVYVREQAQRALKHYFAPGNLTALRELALRMTASRVDQQMLSYMQAHAIPGPWAAGERILVCLSGGRTASQLVRLGKRRADQFRCKWIALYIQTPRQAGFSDEELENIAAAQRLAEHLGGEALTIHGQEPVAAILEFAHSHNITQIILGKSKRPWWFEWVYGSVVRKLIQRSGDIDVSVVTGEPDARPVNPHKIPARREVRRFGAKSSVIALASVVATTAAAVWISRTLHPSDVSLLFLLPVLVSAVMSGLWPALFASVLSALSYNFFLLPPYYEFTIADPGNILAFFILCVVALITSNLASRGQAQAQVANERAKATEELYAFSRKLAAIDEVDDLLWTTGFQVASMLGVRVVLLLPQGESLTVRAGYPPEDQIDDQDMAAARWSWEQHRPAGRGSDTLPGAKWLFLPLHTERTRVGVIGILRDSPGEILTVDQRRLFHALANQAAVALDRIRLAQEIEAARLVAETERLRSALLTSISHDLRTPLASIIGAVTSLRSYGVAYDEAARLELMTTIQEEAERLNRFVGNLLDMTRIESGALSPKLEAVDLTDVVGTVLRRLSKLLGGHRIDVRIPPEFPLLRSDFLLLEQVLANLLDNAAKYSPLGSSIQIEARAQGDTASIRITDEGEGIPVEALSRIFDKFYRVQAGDRQRAGTGLGLAICRGFVEAMNGTITAANRSDRPGAQFAVTLSTRASPIIAAEAGSQP
jgi:two-component system sensor histidine kinase KdpD